VKYTTRKGKCLAAIRSLHNRVSSFNQTITSHIVIFFFLFLPIPNSTVSNPVNRIKTAIPEHTQKAHQSPKPFCYFLNVTFSTNFAALAAKEVLNSEGNYDHHAA
jgi:hypothetical protein